MTDSNLPCRILIVDDEAAHRKLEKAILQSPEFKVMEASDGEMALDFIKNFEFDVVLMDKRMQGMDGDEVCCRIRNDLNLPLLPIIMVTGNTANEELEKSLLAGANDFIRKPYAPIELVARVRAAVSKKRITDQLDSMESMLFSLARLVEAKDACTGDHCSRLEHVAVMFGNELGLNAQELYALKCGGILHDIGKLGIPDNILLKKDILNEDEWKIMKQHSSIGSRLCSGLKSMRFTVPIIRHHHERWDGGGYPDGLKGEEIPFLARVFQIVDIYDALKNKRPYKEALLDEEIISIFEKETSKGWRDPYLVSVFIGLIRNRPEELNFIMEKDKKYNSASNVFDHSNIEATVLMDMNMDMCKEKEIERNF